ncbi:hypothetical protein EKO27_g5246 [Xylaria grammica]|uniref:tyrosinase n=1 Tax=Xylaria grammica TaxID=363999 RepID=A0A439D650_9PEZI|nr:hypothetical protein EKO27_g5246 [Xylaria grammica]
MANQGVRDGTYGISGIPPPPEVEYKTKKIPYAPCMPVRLRLSALAAADTPILQKQWTLFILALEKFKTLPVDQKFSYFQVAGIHGYPATAWDGADPPGKVPPVPDDDASYCTHNVVTFPTWHRPYLLLYEKRLWTHMKEIIKCSSITKSKAREWNEAADTWRLPYWDWAQRQTYNNLFSLPEVFTKETVRIYPEPGMTKTGDARHYPNPLWGFENPEKGPDCKPLKMGEMPADKKQWNIPDDEELPWSQCSGVSRYGITQTGDNAYAGLEGVNNFEAANESINKYSDPSLNPYPEGDPNHDKWVAPGSLADAVNRMFSKDYNRTWATFASTKWWNDSERKISTGYMSLEYIHNNVHILAGGYSLETGLGHMSDVPVAAFDPLFWLHHCNVDRLFAMWQVLNWDEWWTAPDPSLANTTDNPTPDDPLQPFHNKDNGDPKRDFWTSTEARDWTKLFYQYDDLVPKQGAIKADGTLNEEQYKKDLLAHIEAIYPSTKRYVRGIRILPDFPEFFGGNDNSWDDYIINIIYDRYALNGRSYTIQFWLRGDTGDRSSDGNLVGQVYSFAGLAPVSAESGSCANCGSQRDNKVLSRAQVPLTVPIAVLALGGSHMGIRSAEQQAVRAYLKHNLHWKFVQLGGAVKSASDFPDTKISVWRGTGMSRDLEGQKPLPAEFSSYKPLHEITHDKPCGLRLDDANLGVGTPTHFRRF